MSVEQTIEKGQAVSVGSGELVRRLLKLSRRAGYRVIAINMIHKKVNSSVNWPFGATGNIFCEPERRGRSGWPALWEFPKALGLEMGCGNGQQAQIMGLHAEPQTWEIKKRNNRRRWTRIA